MGQVKLVSSFVVSNTVREEKEGMVGLCLVRGGWLGLLVELVGWLALFGLRLFDFGLWTLWTLDHRPH